MAMKAELKEKWLRALRSGRYKQCTGSLRDTGRDGKHTYCCLGVLCNIVNPRNWEEDDTYVYEGWDDCGTLPPNLRKEVGLTSKQEDKLVEMNDVGHDEQDPASFKEIANWIEKHVRVSTKKEKA